MTDTIIVGAALAASILLNLLLISTHAKLRGLVQDGLDAAAKNRYTRVRLNIQSVLDLGMRPRTPHLWQDGHFYDPADFRGKPTNRHPATRRH